MTKERFLSRLQAALKRLPSEEQNDILSDYEEYFSIGLQDGKTEEEIAASLGSPAQLGRDLSVAYHVETVEDKGSASNFFRALWAIIGLSFFNLIIVLGPFLVLAAIILSGWIVAVSFTLSPIGVLINTAIYPEIFELFNLFCSIGLAGLGLLVGITMFYLTAWTRKVFVRYFKYNLRMVRGGMKDV
ncbi:HAAS signaling domain-containing protein [Oceanobacillus sp. FSL H7-0719]|uniref:HAAS signaling domain-containing protein n=1 Tax=Oceanobacillus sp. FSL H7-0719 TaxID=2954507 RepID=UPI003243B740